MREGGWQTGLPGGIDRCPTCAASSKTPPVGSPAVRTTESGNQ